MIRDAQHASYTISDITSHEQSTIHVNTLEELHSRNVNTLEKLKSVDGCRVAVNVLVALASASPAENRTFQQQVRSHFPTAASICHRTTMLATGSINTGLPTFAAFTTDRPLPMVLTIQQAI
ncbi:MAG: hypothetical protein F6J97_16880 [Leptolyngbya sp. SIO4C1]|nr:hypothetical protein [Leptolyngbya sp. SIO4C1]